MSFWQFSHIIEVFFYPLLGILLLLYGFSILIMYFVYKVDKKCTSISYKNKIVSLAKITVSIYLFLFAITLFSLFLYNEKTFDFVEYLSKSGENIIDIIGDWLFHHEMIVKMFLAFIISLIFLAHFLQGGKNKISFKFFLLYTIICTPIIWGSLYLFSHVSLIKIIVIIFIPLALISFL